MSLRFMTAKLVAIVALTLGVPSAALADWLRAETAHFVIYGDTSERSMRAYAEKVERFDTFLRTYYPIQVDHELPKLEIYLANGRRDMLLAEPGISSSVGGFYSPNTRRIHAVVDTESSMGNQVLFHEYGHHFMFQMAANAYPSWFVEGFAEYYATVDIRPDRIQFGRHSKDRMRVFEYQPVNSWAPMADVLAWRVLDSGRYRGGDYYAQAWGLTHYFMSTPERTQMLGQYLTAVTAGEDSVAAMQRVTGRTANQLQTDLRLYLSGPIQFHTPQIDFPTPNVEITTLSAVDRDLIWLDLRLDREPIVVEHVEPEEDESDQARRRRETARREEAEFRTDLLTEALAAGTRHGSDDTGLRVAARAHRLKGDSRTAFQLLEPHLDADQKNARLLVLAAELLLDQTGPSADAQEAAQHRREARSYLARALDADPLDFQTYVVLDDSRRGDPSYPSDNDISTLEVGVTLAPQSFDTRMRLAQAYMARDMPTQAMAIVQPLANNPHGGVWAKRAKALIATAQAAAGQPVDPIVDAPPEADQATIASVAQLGRR